MQMGLVGERGEGGGTKGVQNNGLGASFAGFIFNNTNFYLPLTAPRHAKKTRQ